jgi:hypothetical protein
MDADVWLGTPKDKGHAPVRFAAVLAFLRELLHHGQRIYPPRQLRKDLQANRMEDGFDPSCSAWWIGARSFFQDNRSTLLREIFNVAQFETRVADCAISRAAFDAMDHEAKKPFASQYFAD